MFSIYKRHNNKLYNKLVELSRNKFFYQEIFGEHQRGRPLKLRLNFWICCFEPQQQIKFTWYRIFFIIMQAHI